MTRHKPFDFHNSEELLEKASTLGIELPFQEDLRPLFAGISLGKKKISNRFAVQPMEGYDAQPDGSPSDLTFRRYKRFAGGGSALIWFEAASVVPEGRSNPRQLWLHRRNGDSFARLVEETREEALRSSEDKHDIYCVLQLTHSGRYSKPQGYPQPHAALYNPILDGERENLHIFSDKELDLLKENFIEAALLAHRAGFDAVDIKACHGYVINELLAGYSRQNSRYGGTFDNRVRFLRDVTGRIRQEVPSIGIAVRINAYDGIPFPYGFGSAKEEPGEIDLAEPKRTVKRLLENGCSLLNVTAGIPYLSPHLGRPFDRPLPGAPIPPEHPMEGVSRLLSLTAALQEDFPDLPVVGTGYSWLRQYYPHVGAAILGDKKASFVGTGRNAIAYPYAPVDLMEKGKMDPKKVCISCSRCTELMRMGGVVGCVMKDKEIYGKAYRDLRKKERASEIKEKDEKDK
jgi:2,4-dienoyl-CoA reductase-like NADH-dependent reductase (Old Yellow Enzyme family)